MMRCKNIRKAARRTYLVRAEEEQTTADDSSQEGEKKKGENINTTPSTSYKQHEKKETKREVHPVPGAIVPTAFYNKS